MTELARAWRGPHDRRWPGRGFPCRIKLDDAKPGETLLLVNHVSHEGDNPYRASHAIFVSESASEAAIYEDEIPPALDGASCRCAPSTRDGMMIDAALAQPGEADAGDPPDAGR